MFFPQSVKNRLFKKILKYFVILLYCKVPCKGNEKKEWLLLICLQLTGRDNILYIKVIVNSRDDPFANFFELVHNM